MPSTPETQEMVRRRQAELLAKGHRPGLVGMAMEWAVNSAAGMEDYFTENHGSNPGENLFARFLPRYLREAESWMKPFEEG